MLSLGLDVQILVYVESTPAKVGVRTAFSEFFFMLQFLGLNRA